MFIRKVGAENMFASLTFPAPTRAFLSDDPVEVLGFAAAAFDEGGVEIATLFDIRGGAARAFGSHVVVASDGRFCGYVSGGCVEAAVAAEALLALEDGRGRMVKFGDGSPFHGHCPALRRRDHDCDLCSPRDRGSQTRP